jgi:Concanavalin A-like lectin/glucanases superfamily
MTITNSFTKTYSDKRYQYTTTVRHQGTVIAFAMDDRCRIDYSILALDLNDESQANALDVNAWMESPQPLAFPSEIAQVGFSVANLTVMPTVKQGSNQPIPDKHQIKPEETDRFLSSTARLSANAPFQVVSDGKNVFVIRQSIAQDDRNIVLNDAGVPIVNSTLLFDRFVLVGHTLQLKREVRYQRSRHKTRPQSDKDSLNALDMEGKPFIEPTQELDFVRNLSDGRFIAIVLPTQIATLRRWQIFAYNSKTESVDAYNFEQSPDGLFNTQGTSFSESINRSESALSLNGKDQWIEISKPKLPIGNAAYTIEAWVQGRGTIVSWGQEFSNVLRLNSDGLINAGFGQDLIAKIKLTDGWHHVAATFDGTVRVLYLDGIEIGKDQPKGSLIQSSDTAQIGALKGQELFKGTIDEVRVWDRSRSALEIIESHRQRLVGNEFGLVAYWRLDEATGDRVFDSTDSAHQGKILGNATWVKSDAPVLDTVGICRDSFQIEGRSFASGISALMYYQQENEKGGYNQESKPLKKNARVMLAVNTQSGSNPAEISILDFAVSQAGKLAQLPDRVKLPALAMQGASAELQKSIADRSQRITQLQQSLQQSRTELTELAIQQQRQNVAALELNVRNLTQELTRVRSQITEIQSRIVSLAPGSFVFQTMKIQLNITLLGIKPHEQSVQEQLKVMQQELQRHTLKLAIDNPKAIALEQQLEQDQRDLQNHEALLQGELSREQGEQSVPMQLLNIDRDGLTIAGGTLKDFVALDTPYLFDSATGQLALYFRGRDDQFRSAYYDTLTARATFPIAAGNGKVLCIARSTEAELDRLQVKIEGDSAENCTVTIGGAESIQEVWENVPRSPEDFATVINGSHVNYDYSNATSNRILADLSRGSLLVRIAETIGEDAIENGTFKPQTQTLACRWVGTSPGNALTLTGAEYGKLSAGLQPANLAAERNLSLEAWIKPDALSTRSRLLQQKSGDQSQYALGLEKESMISALRFAPNDRIELDSSEALGLRDRDFTIEVWVNLAANVVQNTTGNRGILGTDSIVQNQGLHLVIRGNKPYFGFYQNDTPGKTVLLPNTWYHLAFRYTKATGEQAIFVNGELDTAIVGHVAYQGKGLVKLAQVCGDDPGSKGGYPLEGAIDDVRIWNHARSNDGIKADFNRRLTGNETGLTGYWHFEARAKDYSRSRRDGTIVGTPKLEASPLPAYAFFAQVGNQALRAKNALPCGHWNAITATFRQAYAVRLDGRSGYLDCGNSPTLDINRDLTIEAFIKPQSSGIQPIVTKGQINDGTDQNVPYGFYLHNGNLVFVFETTTGELQEFRTDRMIASGQFVKVAVTRQYHLKVETVKEDEKDTVKTTQWYDIRFYVNGSQVQYRRYPESDSGSFKDAGSNDRTLEIGKGYSTNGNVNFFDGTISEVRLWNAVRSVETIGDMITGSEKGLLSWWRFGEAEGSIAYDSKSGNHATLKGSNLWVKTPDPNGSKLTLYSEGLPIATQPIVNTSVNSDQFSIGATLNANTVQETYKGVFKDLRIWKTVRTQEQLQDSLFTPVLGEREDLLAYYSCNAESKTEVLDQSLNGYNLTFFKPGQPIAITPPFVISKAPIGNDIPQIQSVLNTAKNVYHEILHSQPGVQEYGDMQVDTAGNLIGVLKRCYSFIKHGQWQLITGFKVGNLVTEWIGQVQSDPQLIGFIEGAPPVPSENLTVKDDYSSASSVELTEAQSTNYTYASSRDKGFDTSIEGSATFGGKSESFAGFGFVTSMEQTNVRVGIHTSFENSLGWLEDSSSGTGRTTTKASKMALQGNTIEGRFIPRNVGFALVQSETADVFALRLEHNNALVSYQMRPNPDIPRDWNIITFPMNATYTKQGTLDGKVGLTPDSQYPNATTYSPDSSYFKPIEAYSLKNRIQREQEQLKAEFDQFDAGGLGRRQSVTHFSDADLAKGRSLDKLPKLHKRNLVNTYVWTADGGLFAESEETLDVQQESMGGSYAFKGMAGLSFSADVAIAKVAMGFELQAMFGGHLNLTVTKSSESQTAFGMNIELDVERDIMQRDRDGNLVLDRSNPLQPEPKKQPGKVDAYRFMTFYLEPKTNHFDDFFNRIVDPLWLAQSNDPNAIALRQTQQVVTKPSCWRVMHRVTYVSRVLETVPSSPNLTPLEKTLTTIDVSSNYELIRRLDPLVRNQRESFGTLSKAIRDALKRYLPELLPHAAEVIQYMSDYYGTLPN